MGQMGYLRPMKPVVWVRRVKISAGTGPVPAAGDGASVRRLSLADKAAFVLLAAGLLALGGVLMAAGVALLLALAAGGAVIGTIAFARSRLFGRSAKGFHRGEIEASGVVLPGASHQSIASGQDAPRTDLRASGPAPRAD